MKTAIIIHGLPTKEGYLNPEGDSESNCHWLPWLQKQLIIQGVLAQTPEMPTPYDPNYIEWKKVLMQFEINEDTILVGHSCGGGFITRFLSEENVHVGKVVLVAPWIDPKKEITKDMFDFSINKNIVSKTKGITIFESTNDTDEVKETIKLMKEEVANIKVVTFKDYGHFCLRNMKTREFPELLDECLK
jgi:predicted alpha/beta hydrolase family esterase